MLDQNSKALQPSQPKALIVKGLRLGLFLAYNPRGSFPSLTILINIWFIIKFLLLFYLATTNSYYEDFFSKLKVSFYDEKSTKTS